MTKGETKTVLLCGVGGQGTILAADLLAKTALAAGYDAKVSEIHGMSQRGGAVTTIVRFGKDGVMSMVTDPGCADAIVSFETTETLRNISFLKEGGYLLVADETIEPMSVLTGRATMPTQVTERLCDLGAVVVPAGAMAAEVGSPKSVNVVLLGALAPKLDFPAEVWEETIAKRVPPKTIEQNIAAFRAGWARAVDGEEE